MRAATLVARGSWGRGLACVPTCPDGRFSLPATDSTPPLLGSETKRSLRHVVTAVFVEMWAVGRRRSAKKSLADRGLDEADSLRRAACMADETSES